MSTPVTLTFLGAAGTVTGSKFLLSRAGQHLLVDAGMFQGLKTLRLRNRAPFMMDPARIGEVLVTHAHADHTGYLPALVKLGFRGPIRATRPTLELAEIVLRDSAYLQELATTDAIRGRYSRHTSPTPLYDSSDVERTLPLFRPVPLGQDVQVGRDAVARWTRAGHILGSASINVATDDSSVLFSGDLGRPTHPILRPRQTPPPARTVVMESTYGGRLHPEPAGPGHEEMAEAVRRAVAAGGQVVIPAFAVDRTEGVLHVLADMMADGRIPQVPVVVDSPMALRVLDVYRAEPGELLPGAGMEWLDQIPDLRETRSAAESKTLSGRREPMIIVSSSGMCEGGRVLHHLARLLPDPRNAVVLTGYQAVGTRGSDLSEGARRIKLFGRYVKVGARVVSDDEFSVHADADDLIGWLRDLGREPETIYLVHGEKESALALQDRIHQELGWTAVVPRADEVVRVD
ncbi:MBL fold metallo-hydrolase [Acidipropionibacterium jensenii]|uniref:MBL fold metallo-hydrolase n=1 Tax=Acidipropionibacterium jensenii TaxID=1749 RepID=A0A3T0RZ38_9ACTN|nr:MBL fold metallo-hydrolase [Acidipropionibacterium jensenii]AZZ39375.1 MBL fold metallo-hydrolase [Acidipropionibacterium jensenii]QCV88818.1 MBL fold metallo-hydrolase [Acidipropionibacterium jensenii]